MLPRQTLTRRYSEYFSGSYTMFGSTQARRNQGAGGRGEEAPRFLLNSNFYELKKIVLKEKIVKNFKTIWNFSKFVDIYNMIIELNTRDWISCQ